MNKQLKLIEEDVMKTSPQGEIFMGGKPIPENELGVLKAEAAELKKMKIWKVLTETLREQAMQAMFEKAKNWEDMLNGKNILYAIGVQENILNILTRKEE
jgi:hypothetical protein